ncbi:MULTISPECIES: hypothetical protein [Pseudomonas aeruginosa group]|uniref:Peptidase MA superfamily protein n=2 Tax=Pseudomonas aeruginosa group TaxID=136841 RepID=A0A2R3IRE0_9PSED|nr:MULTISPECIES: hypothetical protein [Pseudomonas aeruginosa group]VTS65913.1 Uncharacterised protein [Streptococcus dysgalactiae subsp. equisimilis]AVK04489.1 peptidase MA superfamily protein [Pseudomonas paraeruginosa]AVR69292.1 hypothetical protein B7D75_21075 [Pseudomonas paraeruginosa]AWE94436.1 peptidase MA superfamily protein [Pseudomonas paraeruginosa]KAB0738567.1 hypothetical protein F7O94_29050 [Pseudomonas aeruginosa]
MPHRVTFGDTFPAEQQAALLALVEQAYSRFTAQFASADAARLPLLVQVEPSTDGHAGEARNGCVRLRIAASYEADDLARMIHHEMVHALQQHLLRPLGPYALPTWFAEGMAVACSGQGITFSNRDEEGFGWLDIHEALEQSGHVDVPLMDRHSEVPQSYPCNERYQLWGCLFLYACGDGPRLDERYKKDDGPFLRASELERALAVIRHYVEARQADTAAGFQASLASLCPNPPPTYADLAAQLARFLQD